MSPAAAYAIDCLMNGGLFIALCALAIVPLAAIFASGVTARRLAALQDDPLWQAPLAAIAAALPGMLFLGVAIGGLIAGWSSPCMQLLAGRVLYGAVGAITAVAVWRAFAALFRELAYIRNLYLASCPASDRLAAIGARAGIPVREIDSANAFFALVGVLRPVAVASSSVLARMSDDQIYAALRHEAAHRERRDGLVALVLLFFSSLLPARTPLPDLYRRAREVAADHLAAQDSDRFDLAGAIAVMARTRCASVPALSGDGAVRARVHRLIDDRPNVANLASRSTAVLSLVSTAALGFAPLAVGALRILTCTGVTTR